MTRICVTNMVGLCLRLKIRISVKIRVGVRIRVKVKVKFRIWDRVSVFKRFNSNNNEHQKLAENMGGKFDVPAGKQC